MSRPSLHRPRPHRRVAAVTASTCALLLSGTAGPLVAPAVAKPKPAPAQDVTFTDWDFGDGDPGGTYSGTQVAAGALTLGTPTGERTYDDPFDAASTTTTYAEGTWTSPVVDPAFGLTELVASWNADTPEGSWVEVSVSGDAGGATKWYVLGRWADDDTAFHPTSVSGQGDDQATVAVDTLVAREGVSFDDYRIRVSLLRAPGGASPRVDFVGAMASHVVAAKKHAVSATTMTADTVLDVPTYSQETHIGDYPQWDGGGEAWCSPTSTTMVVRWWDATEPPAVDYQWVLDDDPAHVDPYVDHAARHTYDYAYDGAGNWPFNTAYAATFDNEAFVTRLRSLAEAERFVKAGIPLVVSMSFKKGELSGAGYGTNGHLLTVVGFEADGDVVVNDPASHLVASNDAVRVVYDRAEFERAWIGSTGGITYVVHPESAPLPTAPGQANW